MQFKTTSTIFTSCDTNLLNELEDFNKLMFKIN